MLLWNAWKVGDKEKMLRMLREVKVLYVHPVGKTPSLDDCYDAIDIAMKNSCYVRMEWSVSHSGWYHRIIDASSNPKDIYESLPKVYGV